MTAIVRQSAEDGRAVVAVEVCGCCLATTHSIPAEWHTARRILAGEPIVRRLLHERCGRCAGHDPFLSPCAPRGK